MDEITAEGNTGDKSEAAIEAVSKINVALVDVYSAIEQAEAERERIPEDIFNAIDRFFPEYNNSIKHLVIPSGLISSK